MTNLSIGKALEQWLGRVIAPEGIILRWIRIRKDPEEGFVVGLFEAIQSERADYDIYGLYARERDEQGALQQVFGNAKYIAFPSSTEAIAHAVSIGAAPERFVNDGFLQDEYLLATGRAAR